MNTTYFLIIAVILAMIIVAAILAPIFIRRQRTERLQSQFGTEYDHTLQQAQGDEKQAQTELETRQKYIAALELHPLSVDERERYLADWAAVQSKFVDEPGPAIAAADRLIMEAMQLRGYPVSDFEQRAADLSVSYPALVSNYRAARAIALKNEQQQADTEELRQAMLAYHSLFDELIETEAVVA